MSEPIRFWATIAKVQTLADSGLRFTLDAPEQAIMAAAELMACKRMGVVVDVVVTVRPTEEPVEQVGTSSNAKPNRKGRVDERPKREPKWATEEKPHANGDPENGGEQDS